MRFKVPATSANLGIGFDCMGLALDLYNEFEVIQSSSWEFIDFMEQYANEDNLFVVAYKKALKYKGLEDECLKVKITTNIPISRGLGSSACLIVAGIYACSRLHDDCFTKEEMLKLASEMEGHPDNVAPCIYGGLCIVHDGILFNKDVSNKWNFTLFVPEVKVSTEKAREVLPTTYQRNVTVNNVSAAIMALDALSNPDSNNLKYLMDDMLHEPYRKKLIPNFDEVKEYALENGCEAFVISGSGSSCLGISRKPLELTTISNVLNGWSILQTSINKVGIKDV